MFRKGLIADNKEMSEQRYNSKDVTHEIFNSNTFNSYLVNSFLISLLIISLFFFFFLFLFFIGGPACFDQ
jgi:hypothetical protein